MKKISLVFILCFVSLSTWASHFSQLDRILGVKPSEELVVGYWKLRLAKMFIKNDPEAKSIVSGLKKVTISEYELNGKVNTQALKQWMRDMKKGLLSKGAQELVNIDSGDEHVSITAKVKGSHLIDLLIMTHDIGEEFEVIKLKGKIDVADISGLNSTLGVNVSGINYVKSAD